MPHCKVIHAVSCLLCCCYNAQNKASFCLVQTGPKVASEKTSNQVRPAYESRFGQHWVITSIAIVGSHMDYFTVIICFVEILKLVQNQIKEKADMEINFCEHVELLHFLHGLQEYSFTSGVRHASPAALCSNGVCLLLSDTLCLDCIQTGMVTPQSISLFQSMRVATST